MRLPLPALGALAAIGLAACGGGDNGDGDGGGTDRRPAVPAPARIEIRAPADGAKLRAKAVKADMLRVRARLRGSAPPGSQVFVSASCRPRPCRARATADSRGSWEAPLTLTTPRTAGFVSIDVNAAKDVVAAGSAVATVELTGPPRRRPATSPASAQDSGRSRGSTTPPPPSARPTRPALPREVLVIGDSLAVGIAAPLEEALSGWDVRVDGDIGRPLGVGMRILSQQSRVPPVLAFSLFTNDDPRSTAALESAVRATAGRRGGCAVWATVVRPPLNGVSYAAANRVLHELASDPELALGLQLVDWSAEVAQSPSLLAGDGVHATPSGYRALALLYADAIRRCAGGG